MTTVTPRTVRTRRVAFSYPEADLPKHFAGDDLVMSHVVAVLSSLFPEGEDFFVRTVRNYRDEITDPELKKQVAGFIGQEAIHGREHRVLNERLAELGYPTRFIDRVTGLGLKLGERVLPRSVQLAITAALEHYTATLAEVLLADPAARERLSAEEIRSLLLWHALEENEHKSVAFDVYQHVSGNQRIRSWVMHATTVGFLGGATLGTLLSLVRDPATWKRGRLRESLRRLPASPWVTREVRAHIRDYHRPDFHPDDHDTTALIEQWKAELFGDGGTLADRLGAKASA
jgi:uncharacterized protein